jgi:hypothetical protein
MKALTPKLAADRSAADYRLRHPQEWKVQDVHANPPPVRVNFSQVAARKQCYFFSFPRKR